VGLTRRNLRVRLPKLDDPLSAWGLIDPNDKLLLRAVPTVEDRGDAASQAAAATEGAVALTCCELRVLLAGLHCPSPGPDDVVVGGLRVRVVDNDVD
jgi:hypothetical protein